MRPANDECYEICKLCCSYLNDGFSSEKGLFRTNLSQTDVRVLQSQLANNPNSVNRIKEESDPHLVAEVLLVCFRDMVYPLFYEVYDDIVNTELSDEDFNFNRNIIQKWLLKLPDHKFALASQLFRLLSDLASIDESDANLNQLAYSIAPTICRPIHSAFMSIRHMEDLRKIRPVMSFMIANYDDTFSIEKSSHSRQSSLSPEKSFMTKRSPSRDLSNSSNFGIDPSFLSPTRSNSMDSSSSHGGLSNSNSLGGFLNKPNLLVMIPQSNSVQHNMDLQVEMDLEKMHSDVPSYNEHDWKILESIVFGRVCAFLESRGGPELSSSLTRADSMDSTNSDMNSVATDNSQYIPFGVSPVDVMGSSDAGDNYSNSSKKIVRGKRRRMVMECKSLRSQIFDFEQDWSKKYGRVPKGSERGSMQSVYAKYRSLKVEIRELAALDLQRCGRGMLGRIRAKKAKNNTSLGSNGSSSARKSSANSVSNDTKITSRAKTAPTSTNSRNNSGLSLTSPPKGGRNSPPMSYSKSSPIPVDIYTKYRDLLNQKRDLKKKLKKFDEDFLAKWSRQPKKTDKEVIRPMYQKYHEIKGSLDELKAVIESSHGPLPEELMEDRPATSGSSVSGFSDSESEMSVGKHKRGSQAKSFVEDDSKDLAGDTANLISLDDIKRLDPSRSNNDSNMNLEALQLEKKNLHAYLKVYERDFQKIHDRPVMKHEDIQPVAHEYQRYKELKSLIKDFKSKK